MNHRARPDRATPAPAQQPRWARAAAVAAGVLAGGWAAWCSVVALIGGTSL